jgi:nitrite reductase/ring-hydroxylating ferredoxin subunit
MKSTPLLLIFGTALVLLTFTSCDRSNRSGIPYVPVNYQITVSNPEFSALLAVGGYVTIAGGSKGIIVYRFSPEGFRAYDRHCTFMIDDNCRVTMDNTDISAVDTECCDSKFLIIDGSPIDGPAAIGLQQYNTEFDGNTLSIFN